MFYYYQSKLVRILFCQNPFPHFAVWKTIGTFKATIKHNTQKQKTSNTKNIMKEKYFAVFMVLCCLLSCGSPNKRSAEGGKTSDITKRRDILENKGAKVIDAKDSANITKDSVKRQRDTACQEVTRICCWSMFDYDTDKKGRFVAFNMDGVKEVAAMDTPIYRCNLSYRFDDAMPDLSKYNIVHLDLSHNNIGRSFSLARLPQTLETLNLSYNRLGEGGSRELQTLSFRGEWEKRKYGTD